jgi:hypothetical protein
MTSSGVRLHIAIHPHSWEDVPVITLKIKKSGRRISTAPALLWLFLSKDLEESLETFN